MNKIIITGRLTAHPELRTTLTGTEVCTITVACQRSYVSKSEERQTDFFKVVAWKGNAQFVHKYFTKGTPILVEGSMQTRTYEDKNGNKKEAYEIIAEKIEFFSAKKAEEEITGTYQELPDNDVSEDDLPF